MKEVLIFASGLVLFLFGMRKLSAGVQQLFTSRIREYIRYSVRRPVYGLLTGIVTTILFQSSGATTLLTVGMVSAGLMTFYHSLGLILGADIGTVLTVQLVVWKFADISPLIIVSGGILWLTGKAKWKDAGEAIFYFGLLFFGLSLVAMTTAPLKDNQAVIRFFQETKNPLLGLGVGIIFTGIVQASVIPISILAILAQQDLITIENALPVVFGANVGTTVTALMASAVANISGKRSAVSHLFFKCFGAVACMVALPWLIVTLKSISSNVAQQIVLGHLLFNLFIVAFFIFFLKPFARLIEKIIPGQEEILPLWPEFLDDRYLANPQEALVCVRKELQREIILVQKILHREPAAGEGLQRMEEAKYHLCRICCRRPAARDRQFLAQDFLSATVTGSCHENSSRIRPWQTTLKGSAIMPSYWQSWRVISIRRRSALRKWARKNWEKLSRQATENLRDAVSLIGERDAEKITNIAMREEDIDVRVKEARERHLVRYYEGICQAEAGPIFIEMLMHLERISDLCQNVAEYVDELKDS